MTKEEITTLERVIESKAYREFLGIYQDNGLSLPSSVRHKASENIGIEAAKEIIKRGVLQASQPQWHYPERGELPGHRTTAWISLGEGKVIHAKFFWHLDPTDCYFYDADDGESYCLHQVYAWAPVIVPNPPAQ